MEVNIEDAKEIPILGHEDDLLGDVDESPVDNKNVVYIIMFYEGESNFVVDYLSIS
jgi:hypothetical protein